MPWHDTPEETIIRNRHFQLMLSDDHDGYAHCPCEIAQQLREIDERHNIVRAEFYRRGKVQTKDIQGVNC